MLPVQVIVCSAEIKFQMRDRPPRHYGYWVLGRMSLSLGPPLPVEALVLGPVGACRCARQKEKAKLCSARGPQWISSPKILLKCGVDSLQGASRNPRMPGNRFALAHKAAYRRLGTRGSPRVIVVTRNAGHARRIVTPDQRQASEANSF